MSHHDASISYAEAAGIVRQIATATAHLHSLNIAHRDLKVSSLFSFHIIKLYPCVAYGGEPDGFKFSTDCVSQSSSFLLREFCNTVNVTQDVTHHTCESWLLQCWCVHGLIYMCIRPSNSHGLTVRLTVSGHILRSHRKVCMHGYWQYNPWNFQTSSSLGDNPFCFLSWFFLTARKFALCESVRKCGFEIDRFWFCKRDHGITRFADTMLHSLLCW